MALPGETAKQHSSGITGLSAAYVLLIIGLIFMYFKTPTNSNKALYGIVVMSVCVFIMTLLAKDTPVSIHAIVFVSAFLLTARYNTTSSVVFWLAFYMLFFMYLYVSIMNKAIALKYITLRDANGTNTCLNTEDRQIAATKCSETNNDVNASKYDPIIKAYAEGNKQPLYNALPNTSSRVVTESLIQQLLGCIGYTDKPNKTNTSSDYPFSYNDYLKQNGISTGDTYSITVYIVLICIILTSIVFVTNDYTRQQLRIVFQRMTSFSLSLNQVALFVLVMTGVFLAFQTGVFGIKIPWDEILFEKDVNTLPAPTGAKWLTLFLISLLLSLAVTIPGLIPITGVRTLALIAIIGTIFMKVYTSVDKSTADYDADKYAIGAKRFTMFFVLMIVVVLMMRLTFAGNEGIQHMIGYLLYYIVIGMAMVLFLFPQYYLLISLLNTGLNYVMYKTSQMKEAFISLVPLVNILI